MAQVFQCDASGKLGERGGVVVYDANPDDSDTDPVRKEVCAEVWAELMAILEPTEAPKRKRRTKAEIEADAKTNA
jgi:hypothetical protein